MALTHWGRVTHMCVGKLTIIVSDNGLSPRRHQAIIWTNAGILLIGPLGTILNEILVEIDKFSFKKMHLKMSSEKWRPFCLGLNVFMTMTVTRFWWNGQKGERLVTSDCVTVVCKQLNSYHDFGEMYFDILCLNWLYNSPGTRLPIIKSHQISNP